VVNGSGELSLLILAGVYQSQTVASCSAQVCSRTNAVKSSLTCSGYSSRASRLSSLTQFGVNTFLDLLADIRIDVAPIFEDPGSNSRRSCADYRPVVPVETVASGLKGLAASVGIIGDAYGNFHSCIRAETPSRQHCH
jgi:hypothetical protein